VVGGGFGDGAAYPFKHGPFVTGQGIVDGAMLGREEHAERRNRFVEACDTRWRVNPRSTQNGAA
jgi:hypothetical protein